MQSSLYNEIIQCRLTPVSVEADALSAPVSKYSPVEIRETISKLVAEDRMDLAVALGEAGLALYPHSEDVLAVTGLMAMLREDWESAVSLLNELLVAQGENAPVTTHLMFIRSLRCALEPAAALSAVMLAHEHYPNHPELEAEFQAISVQLGIKSAV
jgi:hypothetical protein